MSTATRKAFGLALEKLGDKYKDVVCLDADLSKSTMSCLFAKKFPERFFEMGIQEANMIGCAAGMSFAGKIPFICSFGAFLTGRFDQIRMSIGYANANVKLIGTHSGVGIGEDGHSQMGLEDVALMRSIPNMVVLQPGDAAEAEAMVEWAINHHGPVYLRLTRQGLPDLTNGKFELGKFQQISAGKSIAFLASGGLLPIAHEAAKLLPEAPSVYNASTIKPLNAESMKNIVGRYQQLVVLEDHTTEGGVGSAVCEWVCENAESHVKVIRYGVKDVFGESGSPAALYEKHGFTPEKIAEFTKGLVK